MIKNYFLPLLTFFLFVTIPACISQKQQRKRAEQVRLKEEQDTQALTLLHATCFPCHNPDMGTGKRLAPPMYKVREHYYDEKIKKENFITKITTFVTNPDKEKAIMYGAIRNFGLMPKNVFNTEELKIIIGYIYDNDLSSDKWKTRWEKFKKALLEG